MLGVILEKDAGCYRCVKYLNGGYMFGLVLYGLVIFFTVPLDGFYSFFLFFYLILEIWTRPSMTIGMILLVVAPILCVILLVVALCRK